MEIPDSIDEEFMHTQTLFIPQSQSQRYHLQHIQYYKNGGLHNLSYPSDKSLEMLELEEVMDGLLPKDVKCPYSSPATTLTVISHVTEVIQALIENMCQDREIFVDNITINQRLDDLHHRAHCYNDCFEYLHYHDSHPYDGEEMMGDIKNNEQDITAFYASFRPCVESWSAQEIMQGYKDIDDRREYLEHAFADTDVVIKMDIYVVLPYSEEMLCPQSPPHREFLEKFQDEWEVERPWRYVCVRNWILIPRIDMHGKESFGLKGVADYARDIRYQIFTLFTEDSADVYQALRKYYAYLLFIKKFCKKHAPDHDLRIHDLRIHDLRIHDQLQFYLAQQYNMNDVDNTIEKLETFFQESSVAYVYSLLCDIRSLDYIKSVHPRLDTQFIQQCSETVHYLLNEHHIGEDTTSLQKYVNERTRTLIDSLPIHPLDFLYPLRSRK